jgi:hypothetical protein
MTPSLCSTACRPPLDATGAHGVALSLAYEGFRELIVHDHNTLLLVPAGNGADYSGTRDRLSGN